MVGKRTSPQQPEVPIGYEWYKPFGSKENWISIGSFSGCTKRTVCKLVQDETGFYYLKEFKGQPISKKNLSILQPWVDELNA